MSMRVARKYSMRGIGDLDTWGGGRWQIADNNDQEAVVLPLTAVGARSWPRFLHSAARRAGPRREEKIGPSGRDDSVTQEGPGKPSPYKGLGGYCWGLG